MKTLVLNDFSKSNEAFNFLTGIYSYKQYCIAVNTVNKNAKYDKTLKFEKKELTFFLYFRYVHVHVR